MKKLSVSIICLFAVLLLTACSQTAAQSPAQQTPATSAVSPSLSAVPPSAAASATTEAPAATQTQQPEPSNSAQMYSSYAHMASFDSKTGWAQFDYFDMLKGNDAMQWLVENKGYTKASAKAEVRQYADSEFVEKNTNPQLRTVDLNSVSLRIMYTPDGAQVQPAEPVAATLDDVRALYAKDSSLVLNSFFYYITVENEKAVFVTQVYWP
jgi:hypothetical protein